MERRTNSEPVLLEGTDIGTLRSRVNDLSDSVAAFDDETSCSFDSKKFLADNSMHLEKKIEQISSEISESTFSDEEDYGGYMNHLDRELKVLEDENREIWKEIANLSKTFFEERSKLESELEGFQFLLDFTSQQLTGSMVSDTDNEVGFMTILELGHLIEKKNEALKSLQHLETISKRLDAVKAMEGALSGLKVVEIEGNCLKLSMTTYLPSEDLFKINVESIIGSSELNHEMLIELSDGKMELKKAEIYPNNVYLGDIIDAAKTFRASNLSSLLPRSELEWFASKVQARIILCSLRQAALKVAKSRHSLEYVDREDMIIAHMVGGIDAFIRIPQGWPLTVSALRLVSFKSLNNNSKDLSLGFLSMAEEMANSLGVETRGSIASFVDAIEHILIRKMHAEIHSHNRSGVYFIANVRELMWLKFCWLGLGD